MIKIIYEKQFKKDYKRALKRGLTENDFRNVLGLLIKEEILPKKYHDHKLNDSNRYYGCRECHIKADWLLVYRFNKEELILYLVATGSHSDLFK